MKKNFRYLVFLILMSFAAFGTSLSTSSLAAPVQRPIDPACTSQCVFLLLQCVAEGGKNNHHACFSVYKHCMAQCGKHD
jgi:hypothetical protein